MRAAVITRFGGPEVLEVREVPTPEPSANQVRVRVHASALNRADVLQRRGEYPPPADAPQNIPASNSQERWTRSGQLLRNGSLANGFSVSAAVAATQSMWSCTSAHLSKCLPIWIGAVPERFQKHS